MMRGCDHFCDGQRLWIGDNEKSPQALMQASREF
jgi:hypothetical protein